MELSLRAKSFAYILPFYPYSDSRGEVSKLAPFYRWGNWSPNKLSRFPQLASGKVGIILKFHALFLQFSPIPIEVIHLFTQFWSQ